MSLSDTGRSGCFRAGADESTRDAFQSLQATLRLSLNPSFSEHQISYLEDLLANKLMGIVAHSRNGHCCAACFGVVDGVLDHIRGLRADGRR